VSARLDAVADAVGGVLTGNASPDVTGITHDSRTVRAGDLFCCVVGAVTDGHLHAASAVEGGAAALLVERPLDLDVPQVRVPEVRAVLGRAASVVFGDPSRRLDLVGVTGTNGKTTVVTLLGTLLGALGRRCEVIGTLTGARTTPEATDLQRMLRDHADAGVAAVAMEVSSHALALHRVDGCRFRVAVFTNLGHDHLDFHGTPERYFEAKARLFTRELSDLGVVNLDDVHGRLLRDAATIPTVGYSLDQLEDLEVGPRGSRFRWRDHAVELALPGRFNVANALAAAEAAVALGHGAAEVAAALAGVVAPPGRLEVVDGGRDVTVLVDYAHTPDALANVLDAARELVGPAGALVVVVGCGGDRDQAKRPEMGAVAAARADRVVLTSDNPRSEDPAAIIGQMSAGVPTDASAREVVAVLDRRAAIERAIEAARPGDVVVLAGKGHETTQEVAGVLHPFDDRIVAREVLDRRGGGPT